MSSPEFCIRIFPDLEAVSHHAAELFGRLSEERISSSGRFVVALAGGSTPQRLYSILGSETFRNRILWQAVHFFWGDERFVPHENEESNYLPVFRNLLSRVSISPGNIHAIDTAKDSPGISSEKYDLEMRSFFQLKEGDLPRFDLIILGVGTDGHTASLFPGDKTLSEKTLLAAPVPPAHSRSARITITLPVINSARTVLFLAAGEEKASILARVIDRRDPSLPASLVRPQNGKLIFLIDEKAGGLLHQH